MNTLNELKSFLKTKKISIREAAWAWDIPKSTLFQILNKKIPFKPHQERFVVNYKITLVGKSRQELIGTLIKVKDKIVKMERDYDSQVLIRILSFL